ncbi:MAG: hypothetical protein E6K95_06120 [Thaumarchaeota archaeon]|nr:MAG: hypothetical protein E6K95_06120 [Nitrososphaerota archaeon]TLY15564.1 MAG: hypothetical protein E6K86_06325 [Nitrososphaerota archaeon]TMP99472.1 MAG: hypothetical protein E6K99_04715 [Nitrososphaerota archaeon]
MLRRIAAIITLITSIWAILAVSTGLSLLALPTGNLEGGSTLDAVILIFGVILFGDGLACLVGVRLAFQVAAVDAAALIVSFFLSPNALGVSTSQVAIALSLVTLVLGVAASRSPGKLSEQTNPMNLPVFG